MFQGTINLGRIYQVIIDIDETKYTVMSELGGAFGLQLKFGKDQEFTNPKDDESGPTGIDKETWVVTWDLTIKGRDHPFFLDESKLDSVSNFNFIATRTIYIEAITIIGTHFMTITNHTTIRPAYAFNSGGFPFSMFDINMDNRTDFAYYAFETEGFVTTAPRPLSDILMYTIKYGDPYNDLGHHLKVTTMKAIIVEEGALVLALTPISSPLMMRIDKLNWLSGLSAITYGGQDVSHLPETDFNFEYPSIGYQDILIGLWNANTWVEGYVTNDLRGVATGGVCEFDILNNWTTLANEYALLSNAAKNLIANNQTTMQSSVVGDMLTRYFYVRNTNPGAYTDFLGIGSSPAPRMSEDRLNGPFPLLILCLVFNLAGFYVITRGKVIHH